jgi:hypothetical protein
VFGTPGFPDTRPMQAIISHVFVRLQSDVRERAHNAAVSESGPHAK